MNLLDRVASPISTPPEYPAEADKLFWENANKYRLHQDKLRWTLLAGYATFLGAMLALHRETLPKPELMYLTFAAGICYMFVLGVENFFYNLFAEYVKDCEGNLTTKKTLRSLHDFAEERAKFIGPFHHSYFFALLIVSFGNLTIASKLDSPAGRLTLTIISGAAFLTLLLGWRRVVYPHVVAPLQSIFDLPSEAKEQPASAASRETPIK